MRPIRGNQSTSRALNRLLVLNHLRRFGPATRTDLAAATGLSSAAVTYVSAELLEKQLIVESRELTATGGRRSTPLDLNYDGHLAIGLKLMENSLQAVVTDLGTRALDATTVGVSARDPVDVARATAEAVETLLNRTHHPREELIGIGLGMPGQHDAERGVCLRCHRFGWSDVPIAQLIGERTGAPVWLDNDVNAFALAEHLYGKGKTASSLAVLSFGRGIGAATIVNGQLLRGHSGGAGEIGHLNVIDDGPLCECGRRGCLDAVVSLPAILAAYRTAGGTGDADSADALAARAESGDPVAVAVLRSAGHHLGSAAAALLNLLDPEALVIGGEGVRLGPVLLETMLETLERKNFQQRTAVHVETWGDDAWARGAASLAIDSFFSFPKGEAEDA